MSKYIIRKHGLVIMGLIVPLLLMVGCKTSQQTTKKSEPVSKTANTKTESNTKEATYNDPYAGKAESELTVTELYIKQYRDLAISEMRRAKIPASITIAQGILESGNGNSYLAKKAFNHFGVKCGSDWKGESIYFDDDQANECFRKYKSVQESYIDHSDYLVKSPRYANLFTLPITDYKNWATGLKEAGYATRRNYAELLIDLIEKHNLSAYDVAVPTEKVGKTASVPDEQFKYNGISAVMSKSGDTYNLIAKRNSLSVSKLLEYNDLKEPVAIKEGTVVYIGPKKTAAKESYHIVKNEDRMYSISQDYGILLKALMDKNLLKEGEEPAIGEILYLRQKRSEPAETRVVNDPKPEIKPVEIVKEEPKVIAEEKVETKENNETGFEEVEVQAVENKVVVKEPAPENEENEPQSKVVFEDEDMKVKNEPEKVVEPKATTSDIPKFDEDQPVTLHKVEQGETLFSLSRKYSVSVENLKKWNNLVSNDLNVGDNLIVSQTVPSNEDSDVVIEKPKDLPKEQPKEQPKDQPVVPKPTVTASSPTVGDTVFHIVQDEEILYTISRKYNMTIVDLIALNKLKEYKIAPGQKLIVKLPDKPVVAQPDVTESDNNDFFIKKPAPTDKPAEVTPKTTTPTTKPSTPKEDVATNANSVIHIVQPKETLFSISKLYNTTVPKIKEWNNLTADAISVGQKLIVGVKDQQTPAPKIPTPTPQTSESDFHIVKSGETLYSISKTYGTTVDKIKQLNNLVDNNISLGQKLKIK